MEQTVRVAVVMLLSCCLLQAAYAGYGSSEMFTIPWGDSTNQLKIDLPFYEDVNSTPEDSSDDWIEFNGPKQGFVDKNENIYIASHRYMQLKGFDNTGRLIFDYSKGESLYNPELFKTALRKIYIDSLCHIYVVDGMRYDYVGVADTLGHLINKLSPYGIGSGVIVYDIRFNSDDVLTICCKGPTFYTYQQNSISEGGGRGWLARDGNYYNARIEDSTQIKFYKYDNPDVQGVAANQQTHFEQFSGAVPRYSEFLGIDDNMLQYIYLVGHNPKDGRILIYDTSYNLVDEIDFPNEENKYSWYMTPYMRPSDGNIYEFRCLDDGLHVIRWSKQ
jgi:hypothetical protein